MAGERVRVGVIGTSWWADLEHLPGLRSRPDVEVAALCGRDPGRLARLAEKYAVPRTCTDWRALVGGGGLDAVVVSTPNDLHHPQALAALDAGLHVVCEKPLALDLAQARALAARAEATGRATLTFFTHRAVAAAAHVKALVAEGFLGRPVHASAVYLSASHLAPGKPLSWRMQRAASGTGVLGDIGSHVIDLVRWWLGDFTRVAGQWQTLTRERGGEIADADEDCSFLAELACGAQATFHASKLAPGRGNYQRVELHGTAGTLVYEADPGYEPAFTGRVWAGRPGAHGLAPLALPAALAGGLDGPDAQENRNAAYRRLTDPFFAAIRAGASPRSARSGGTFDLAPDFRDGAAVQAVLDAVAASAERGCWVDVAP